MEKLNNKKNKNFMKSTNATELKNNSELKEKNMLKVYSPRFMRTRTHVKSNKRPEVTISLNGIASFGPNP